jgi:cytochrome d ubiquinol oxidase subunit II
MLVLHGSAWLTMKAEVGVVRDRARRFGTVAGLSSLVLFAAGYAFVAYGDFGFRIAGKIAMAAPSNPLRTASMAAAGAWLDNFIANPWMWTAPVLGFLGAGLALIGVRAGREWPAFVGSSLSTMGTIATVGLSMFPFILPSSIDAKSSLTVFNASSSHLTLFIVTVIFLPMVLLYTAWAFKIMWGRSTQAALVINPDLY